MFKSIKKIMDILDISLLENLVDSQEVYIILELSYLMHKNSLNAYEDYKQKFSKVEPVYVITESTLNQIKLFAKSKNKSKRIAAKRAIKRISLYEISKGGFTVYNPIGDYTNLNLGAYTPTSKIKLDTLSTVVEYSMAFPDSYIFVYFIDSEIHSEIIKIHKKLNWKVGGFYDLYQINELILEDSGIPKRLIDFKYKGSYNYI